ncbi:TetR/AcrR family transcriptional regulator [Nonomuraea sp. NPDC046802]|uniref:TetR/AcrR family transcriptional regulator n=1 Tax=Nonomuraea sp. NPDC046802 TaxID=3154919 RepID=UPI0033EA2A16
MIARAGEKDIQRRILDAAEQCLLRAGPAARLHHVIAERAGVSRPTVYKHLGDQKAIVEALLHRELSRYLDAVRDVLVQRGTLRDRFVETIVFTITYARGHALLQRMLLEEPQIVLPWLTTHAAPVIERGVAAMSPHIQPGGRRAGGTIDPKVVAEWGIRLAVSLITMPSSVAHLDTPDGLRRYLLDLLDLGLVPLPADE